MWGVTFILESSWDSKNSDIIDMKCGLVGMQWPWGCSMYRGDSNLDASAEELSGRTTASDKPAKWRDRTLNFGCGVAEDAIVLNFFDAGKCKSSMFGAPARITNFNPKNKSDLHAISAHIAPPCEKPMMPSKGPKICRESLKEMRWKVLIQQIVGILLITDTFFHPEI